MGDGIPEPIGQQPDERWKEGIDEEFQVLSVTLEAWLKGSVQGRVTERYGSKNDKLPGWETD